MNCNYCKGICIKKGFYKSVQKYRCNTCSRYQRIQYLYKKYHPATDEQVKLLNNESLGISSISRITGIPKTSIQRRIKIISKHTSKPTMTEQGQVYEVDELYTYISRKDKPCYIMYAINRKTRKVIDFVCGARTKENINKIIQKVLSLSPKRIYTDGLNIYQTLIPACIHRNFQYRTNRIERKNLTLRTHLKRLSRKTICYSKSQAMLEACFRLYVWR